MDELAQRDLQQTALRLRDIGAKVGAAHVSATRARDNGGPDFTDRIKTLLEQAEALATSIEKATETTEAPTIEGRCPDNIASHCRVCSKSPSATHARADAPLHGRAGFGG